MLSRPVPYTRAALGLVRVDQLARQGFELSGASRQLFLGTLALGDVGVGSVHADRPAGRIADHGGAAKDPVQTAVGPDDAVLDVAGPGAVEHLAALAYDPVTVVRMHRVEIV